MTISNLRIDPDRLMARLRALGQVGALAGGGVCRLALSDEDKAGRDVVTGWMRELGLDVAIDAIGNVVGTRAGEENLPAVMVGSHIDTVRTGGLFDGNLGVLAGLEIIAVLNDAGLSTRRPVAVGFFTNEEGARFAPDMMGSAVHQGFLGLEEAYQVRGIDGVTVRDELQRIGYLGPEPVGQHRAHCYFELHVEQGPVLEEKSVPVGVVEGVQGISWTQYRIIGVSNHAGTTPMRLRHDAGYVAAAIACEARRIANQMGGDQVATVGVNELTPNLINVIAAEALVTVDLRNTDEEKLKHAEALMADFIETAARNEGVSVSSQVLARFEPVVFDREKVDSVERLADQLGHKTMRLPSGAGHDAQMFAPNCPTAMIFVPSRDGISHNINEYTAPEEVAAGGDVLLQLVVENALK